MRLQWREKLMERTTPLNVTIDLHVDSVSPTLTVNKVFMADTGTHRRFEEDLVYDCPRVAREYRLAGISSFNRVEVSVV